MTLAPLRRVVAEVRSRDETALQTAGRHRVAGRGVAAGESAQRLAAASRPVAGDFVSDAAHELRSPLTALKLQLESIKRAPDDTARHGPVATLSDGIARAARIVEQLLPLARSEPGAPAAAREAPDLSELMRQAVVDTVP